MLNRPADPRDTGEMVASTRDYENAQKTVSKLIAGDVPARDIAIVGQGVRTVERVTGKLGYAAAARSGAINGVLIGLFLSAILVIGNPDVPMQLFIGFVFIGVAVGMILSLVTYAVVRRRRDFASVTQFAADHYEVTVQAGSLAKARQVLGSERTAPVRPAVDLSEPPRYGERVVPGSAEPVIPPRPADPTPATPVAPAVGQWGEMAPSADSAASADSAVSADAGAAAAADDAASAAAETPESKADEVRESDADAAAELAAGAEKSAENS